MTPGGDGQITEIGHEGVTFPAEEEFDFHFIEAVGVQCGAGAHTKGMGGPKLKFFFVANRIKGK